MDSSASSRHCLHVLLRRWCGQMPAPPHSLHWLLMRWCGQMLAPPHSLHWLLMRWCGQMPAPPHSLHLLLSRSCGQRLRAFLREAPPSPAASASPHRRRLPAPPAASGAAAGAARFPVTVAAAAAPFAPPADLCSPRSCIMMRRVTANPCDPCQGLICRALFCGFTAVPRRQVGPGQLRGAESSRGQRRRGRPCTTQRYGER